MVTYLLKTQHDEGYWTGQVSRPPFEESYFTATVLGDSGMKHYATSAQKSLRNRPSGRQELANK